MAEKAKSIVEVMKERISKAGQSKESTFYVKDGNKVRVRFLTDMEDGIGVTFHSKWQEFNHICQKYYGKECPGCKNKEAQTYDAFAYTIYNYESKRKEIFLFKANKASPIPALINIYETYGTICDRDIVVARNGSGTGTTYSAIPMDKSKFKGDDKEQFSKKKILKKLYEMFPCNEDLDDEDEEEDDDDFEEEMPKKKKASKRVVEEDEDDEDDDFDDDDEDEDDDDDAPWDDDDDEDEDEEEEVKPAKKRKK